MESRLAIDTHVALWLFTGTPNKLSSHIKELLGSQSLCISPMVITELQLLYEIDRTKYTASEIISTLKNEINLTVLDIPFSTVTESSLSLSWTRDPFDRLIVASSIALDIPLLTKDKNILDNFENAIW